jgi:DNA-binding SARP family transcriptional activator/TolB-like protein/Tfp pilus assembly protein PilF
MLMSASPRFELRLLGDFSLRCPDRSPDVIPISSKKARALLAYVAMQVPMQAGRERLATLLWPDRVDRQARQNLRACLASLRADLGAVADELLLIDGETVAIKDRLTVDSRRLRKLSRAEAAVDDVAALYRGQFLADLEIESETFRDWASAERVAIEANAGAILSASAAQKDQSGDAAQAIEYASRLTAVDPLREDWFRLSLRITARHLGREQALAQVRNFISLLKKELDVAPEADTVDLIERIKAGRNMASTAEVIVAGGTVAGDANGKSEPAPASEARLAAPAKPSSVMRRDGRAAMTSAIGAAALAAAVMAALFVVYEPAIRTDLTHIISTKPVVPSTIPLRVLSFQSQAADTTGIAVALTENVLANVSRFSGLTVFDGRSALSAQKQSADGNPIQFSVWGSVRREDSTVRVQVGLTDTTNQTVVWAGDYVADGEAVGGLDGALSRRIARDLQVQASYASARGLDDATIALAPLHQLIAKALTIQYRSPTSDDAAAALALYQEALRRDPNSALALIGLAARQVMSSANLKGHRNSALEQADSLLDRALQIDPNSERAYYWRGIIYLERGQRDLALRSFDRALELNPSFLPAEAHAGFALVLSHRTEEGLRRIENALRQSSHDPNERLWLRFAGIAQLELGNDQQAISLLLEAASLATPSPPLRAALASAYALTGERAKSREQFQMMKATADPSALERLLKAASKNEDRQNSRYFQGLRLAAGDIL